MLLAVLHQGTSYEDSLLTCVGIEEEIWYCMLGVKCVDPIHPCIT